VPSFEDDHSTRIGWASKLSCREFIVLAKNKRDPGYMIAISWAFGYVSSWQESAYDRTQNIEDPKAREAELESMLPTFFKPGNEGALAKEIERRCRARPKLSFVNAVMLAAP